MKLLGSETSPYVRRIRLLLGDTNYQFVNLDIYGADRDELRRSNPALKIPMLIDGERSIYDSRVIARYLSGKFGHTPLDWEQENQLTLIDAANDSLVTLVLSKRAGLDVTQDVEFYNLQHERVRTSMQALSEMAAANAFEAWHYPTICLFCLIDWAQMRGQVDLEDFPPLPGILERHAARSMVAETNPGNAG